MPTLHRLHQVSIIQYIRLRPDYYSNRRWNLSTLLLHVQHLSIHQSVNPSIRQSINPSIHQSVNPSICQSINLSIHQSVNPSIHQSVNPSISEECPYCDTRTLVGDNPARWFCSTTLLNSLVQVRQPGIFVRQQSQSGIFPSNGIPHPKLQTQRHKDTACFISRAYLEYSNSVPRYL